METQTLTTLLNFAPVYQILASFFIIFIAIEYSKSYTSIIAKHIFDIEGIHERYKLKLKVDENVINTELDDSKWKENKGLSYKQQFLNDIDSYKTELEVADRCVQEAKSVQYKFESFRYISIYMFVYCMVCLYAAGLLPTSYSAEQNFLLCYSVFSTIIVGLYFLCGQSERLFNATNRTKNLGLLLLLMAISLITISILVMNGNRLLGDVDSLTSLLIEFYSALLPSVVFIVGIIFVYFKSHSIKTEIDKTYKPLAEKHEKLLARFENMKVSAAIDKEVDGIEIPQEN